MQKMQEIQVQHLGQESPQEEEMANLSSILAWKIPWTEEPVSPWGRKESDTTEQLSTHEEYIMWNIRLDESQARIRISRRNINNLRYTDDTILITEIEEEKQILLMKVKEESEETGLKLNIKKHKIMPSRPIMSW